VEQTEEEQEGNKDGTVVVRGKSALPPEIVHISYTLTPVRTLTIPSAVVAESVVAVVVAVSLPSLLPHPTTAIHGLFHGSDLKRIGFNEVVEDQGVRPVVPKACFSE
jgi:uncharacterized lipoprotein YbaY